MKHRTNHGGLIAAVAVTLIFISSTADAVPVLNTYADASGEVFIGNAGKADKIQHLTEHGTSTASTTASIDDTSVQTVIDPGVPGQRTQVTWGVTAGGSAAASASYGALHATSTAYFQLSPGSITFQGYNSDGYPYSDSYVSPFKPEGSGDANASSKDAFMLGWSGSGPWPSSVSVEFTMMLEATIVGYSSESPHDGYGLSRADGDLYLSPSSSLYYAENILGTHVDNTTAPQQTVSVIEQLDLYHYYYIQNSLSAHSEVPTWDCTAPACDGQSFRADAGDTQLLNINVLTPDVTIAFNSRHDYSTAAAPPEPPQPPSSVPGPPSIDLLLVGLGLVFMRHRRSV